MNFSVTLPGQPPSGNHMYERSRGGGVHKKAGVEAYQAMVTHLVREARPSGWKANERVYVRFWFFFGRDVDCTNAMKVIEDGIAMALCDGNHPPACCTAYDRRFLPQAMFKSTGAKEPSVDVEIE